MSTVIENNRYSRSFSEQRTLLGEEIASLYTRGLKLTPQQLSAYQCRLYCSGVNATSNVVHRIAIKNRNCVAIIGNELYSDTPKVFTDVSEYTGMEVVKVHILDREAILKAFHTHGNRVRLFFLESCTNPSGHLFDWSLIPTIRLYSPNCLICVDNTWLSPVLFNPLAHGADLVVGSATKYISASKRIAGYVVTPNPIINDLDLQIRRTGINFGSEECKVIRENLATIDTRMRAVSDNTGSMLEFLKTQPKVTRVHHPGLVNGFYPGCISFHVTTWKVDPKATRRQRQNQWDRLQRLVESTLEGTSVKYETSYGSSYSKIDSFPKNANSNSRDYVKKEDCVPGIWLRYAGGYESNSEDDRRAIAKLIDAL